MTKQDQIEKLKDDVFELRQELLFKNKTIENLKEERHQLRVQLANTINENIEREKKYYNAFSEYLKHYKRIRISTGIELPNPFNVNDIDPTEYAAHIVNKEEA